MQPKRYFQQLKSTSGSDVVSIDITSSSRTATFRFDNIDAKIGREWCYGLKVRLYIRTQVDQPASAGSIIKPDQLYRVLSSIQLKCDDLGTLYSPGDLSGPALGLIAQVVSAGYRFPYHLRSDIPAADGDTPFTIIVDVPLAHMCFAKGHQTGIWNGHLKRNGELQVNLASSTALDAVSTGAVLEATTDVRAELVYTSEPEARVPTIWTWRVRNTVAGETKHTIRNICQGAGITGASGVGKIAFLAYLSDQNGLGGADGIDNITRVYPRDRSQQSHNMSTPFFGPSSFLYSFIEDVRDRNLFGAAQGLTYPQALGTNQEQAPNGATTLFLPYWWPHVDGQDVSKLQEWQGDYNIEHDYTAVPSGQALWLTLEQSYLTKQQEEFLMGDRMGLPASMFTSYPKVRSLNHPGDQAGVLEQQRKLRGIPKKVRAKTG
jgi:hypothetical protein